MALTIILGHRSTPSRYIQNPLLDRGEVVRQPVSPPCSRLYQLESIESGNAGLYRVEVIVSLALLREVARGVAHGGAIVITVAAFVKFFICAISGCTRARLVSSAVSKVILQVAMASRALFTVGLRRLCSFAATLVSVDALGVIINVFVVFSLFYVIARETRMAIRRAAAGMNGEQA